MNKRLATLATLVAAVAAAAGLFARASNSAPQPPNCGYVWGCLVELTASGPSPRTLTMYAKGNVRFRSGDSSTHKVVFANGLCSFTVEAGHGSHGCNDPFMFYVGSYAYTVDGKFRGMVVTTPLPRSVTLTARSHTIRGGTRLTLRGQVHRSNPGSAPPPPVVVLARHSSSQPFEPVATVRTRGSHRITYRWKLDVQPETAATYIAEVTAQGLCYVASRCAHPQGQVWTNAKSRPFTVRIREEGASGAANTQRTIGLVGWDRSGELAGAQAAASALGDQLVVPGGHAKAAILSLIAQHAAAIVVGSDGLSDTDGSGLSPVIAQAHEAGIPTVSFTRRYPGSVWVRQSSDATPVAHALADALASQMKGRGQFVIVSCRHAEPAVATWLQRMKSYIGRRYPHMQLAGVAQRGVEIQPGVWSRLTLGSVLRADPRLRGLIFMCGAAPTGELADAHKLGKVFSVGVDRSCPPLGFPDSYPIRSGATELICTADWTGLGYLTIWAADHLAGGSQFISGSYDVGGPVGAVQFYDQTQELRLVVPPLTLTKANVTQYVTRP